MAFDRGLSSAWKKSTKSLNGNCVEVALRDGRVLILATLRIATAGTSQCLL